MRVSPLVKVCRRTDSAAGKPGWAKEGGGGFGRGGGNTGLSGVGIVNEDGLDEDGGGTREEAFWEGESGRSELAF